jgi:hypothetical protein
MKWFNIKWLKRKSTPKVVSAVHIFVHPFHTVKWADISSPKIQKSIEFLFGLWGSKINEIASDPNAILIFVETQNMKIEEILRFDEELLPHMKWRKWFAKKFARFLTHMNKQMGERFFHIKYSAEAKGNELKRLIHERGFRLAPKHELQGQAFGEYFRYCVDGETRRLQKILDLPNIKRLETHSLQLPTKAELKHWSTTKPIGLDPNLRRTMRKLFKPPTRKSKKSRQ